MKFTITFVNWLGCKAYYCPDGTYTKVLSDGVLWENYTKEEMVSITKRLNRRNQIYGLGRSSEEVYTFQELGGE